MSKNKIPLFSIGIATVVALLCGIHSAQAATISTIPSIATRIQTAWRGIQSANYAISIVNSNGGASAVQGWYGTWQNNSARQTFNAYVWDSTTSTPVLEFVQDAPALYASVSKVNPSSTFAYLQKGWVRVPTSTTLSSANPATVLGIGAPVDNWWSSAQLKKPLEDTLLPLIYDMTDKGNLTWSKMQSDTVNGQNVYRLPFSLTKTALFNLNGNILVDYSLPKPTAVTGQLFVDKTTYLPVRLSIELGSRHIIIDLNNYNGDAITLPSTILTVDQARALVSSSTLAK
jgi:hypothetical protein